MTADKLHATGATRVSRALRGRAAVRPSSTPVPYDQVPACPDRIGGSA